jgi:hypothetical protein
MVKQLLIPVLTPDLKKRLAKKRIRAMTRTKNYAVLIKQTF